ncbi:MAG: hypothetical protein ABEJ84_08650 [Halodesulfurarchaeum sp.]
MTRIGTALRSGARELERTPLLLALLVVAPGYVIFVFTMVAPEGPAIVHIGEQTIRTTLPRAFPAFTTPMTAALLAGITGLFLMQTAAAADSRLVLAGFRTGQLVIARLGILIGVATVASAISIGVMLTAFIPDHLGWFALGTGLVALVYGMVGVIAGVIFDRLPGVYLILFGSMIDLFIFQNPLAVDPPTAAKLLPGHYPLRIVMQAGFAKHVQIEPVGMSVLYLGVLVILATGAFYREMRLG